MDKKLQKYIEKRKRDFLVEEGLFDKIYEPEEAVHDVDEYPHSENNNGLNRTRYYKIVPYDVTDEEFDTLLRLHHFSRMTKNKYSQLNGYATFMIVASVIIYIAGFVGGIIAGNNFERYEFTWWLAIAIWVPTFVYGSLLLGVSEVIKLLHCQRD